MKKKWVWVIIGFLAVGAIADTCSRSEQQDGNSAYDYIQAVNNQDYQKAHEILDYLYANYLEYPNGDKSRRRYWTAADYIYKAEMQWLLTQNDPEADRRLIYTLDAMSPPGIEPVENYGYSLNEYNRQYDKFNAYCSFAEEFNKLCFELIKISLRTDNLSLAETALASMKVCYIKNNKDGSYIYEPNYTDIKRAQDLIDRYKTDNN